MLDKSFHVGQVFRRRLRLEQHAGKAGLQIVPAAVASRILGNALISSRKARSALTVQWA